jgi:hypothetical protein
MCPEGLKLKRTSDETARESPETPAAVLAHDKLVAHVHTCGICSARDTEPEVD